ncbi:MAG TPA: HypC/HybG/HupF family hydrogenase formation chaperone [Candidatus Cybelea sp.]|nr:HypC/HybG/HupF family hydrogenase formation chaperone [Candidatus Cybelea sp.]
MCLGIPGRIVAITDPVHKLGTVEVAGVRRAVNLACIIDEDHPIEACIGDWVLVHVGFAMSRIDEREAEATLALLAELGEVMEAQRAMQAAAAGEEGDHALR